MALQVFKPSKLGRGILIKYLYKELFYYFLICFAFLFVVFFANQILLIGEDMLAKRAPFADVAKIMIYSMPHLHTCRPVHRANKPHR